MATTFTVVNPYTGHGIALVEGEDAAAVEKAALAVSAAVSDDKHACPANRGFTNGPADGAVARDKGGVTVTLFSTATEDEAAAIKGMK